MCLDLDAGVPVSVEGDDAGVVRKHGLAEILAAELAADLGRGVTDAGLVEIVDLFRHARFGVFVMDAGGKNLVLAVLGPRLGHDFHFKIRGICGQAEFRAAGSLGLAMEMIPDGVHFLKAEGPGVGVAHPVESLVVERGKRQRLDGVDGFAGDLRGLGFESGLLLPFGDGLDAVALNEIVAEEVGRDVLHVSHAQAVRRVEDELVLHGRVDPQGFAIDIQNHGRGIAGRPGLIVRDAGTEADFDEIGRFRGTQGQGLEGGFLQNGIVPDGFLHQPFGLGPVEAVNREDLDLTDGADLEAERAFDVLGCAAALGIIKTGSGSGFYTVEHVRLLHLVRYWFYFLRSRTKSAICMRILRSAQSGVFSRASRALER